MPPQRILVLHNRYREPGGEDHAFAQEVAMLRDRGHEVIEYVDSNDNLDESRPIAAGLEAIWSGRTVRQLDELIADTQPDLAHFHNTFLRISPAAYYACHRAGIPVVQTLHNFRLGCLNGCCTIGGKPCLTCVEMPVAWPGIWHGCYRDSRMASAAVAGIGLVHRTLGTYRKQVDAYISTSEFARSIHLRSGVPTEVSFFKPNSSIDAAPVGTRRDSRRFALFAGRMVPEKGVRVLLEAWRSARPPLRLALCGDGPELAGLSPSADVEFLGQTSRARVLELMAQAEFLVQPSLLLENCALSVIEAMSAGLPVIASGHGSFAEIVEDGRSGLHFRPGDAADLAEKVGWMATHREERMRMGQAARERFDRHYSPEKNYEQLLNIYAAAARRQRAFQHS